MHIDPATVTILVAVVGGPVGGAIASKYLKPKASPMERIEVLEHDFRVLQDYTHSLRKHIANGNPPPPPPWPEGLTQ